MMLEFLSRLSNKCNIVLGSSSPRRVELLTRTGINFNQQIPQTNETILPGENPFVYAIRLAEEKGSEIARNLKSGEIAITGDTIVILNENILGKPSSKEDAFSILSQLSGENHIVCTALALTNPDGLLVSGEERTGVFFNKVSPTQINNYIDSGEPMDKAGAYGIQGMGAFLVDRIEGNLDNVIGLPLALLESLAGEALQKLK